MNNNLNVYAYYYSLASLISLLLLSLSLYGCWCWVFSTFVKLSIYLSIHLSIYLSIHPSIHPSIHGISHHVIIHWTKIKPKCRNSVWKTKYTLTASVWINRLSSSQAFIIKYRMRTIKAEVLSVCWSGAIRCVSTQCRGGMTSAMIVE